MLRVILTALAVAFTTTSAFGAPTTFTASGHISSIPTLVNSQSSVNPSGDVKVGDAYTFSATFDLSQAELTAYYNADPTINIYYLPGTTITYSIGSFSRSFKPSSFNSSLQFWNGYAPYASSTPTDAQSYLAFDYPITDGNVPFKIGSGPQSVSLTFGNFDYTAKARSSDLISQLTPFSSYGNKLFTLGQLNQATNTFVYVNASIENEALSVVPEPASWAFMSLGTGAVGYMMRRRRKAAARIFNAA